MKIPVSEEDRLLAMMESVSVEGPTLLESVSSATLHTSVEETKSRLVSTEKKEEKIEDFEITKANVKTYHQGVETSKSLLNITKTGSSYTEYEIVVEAKKQHRRWTVYRRYTHFK